VTEYLTCICNARCCDGKGCKRSYHLPCLNPPLQDTPPGVWLCHLCVRKKVESGVHSVSEGIESIWDVKEGEVNSQLLDFQAAQSQLSSIFRRLVYVRAFDMKREITMK